MLSSCSFVEESVLQTSHVGLGPLLIGHESVGSKLEIAYETCAHVSLKQSVAGLTSDGIVRGER